MPRLLTPVIFIISVILTILVTVLCSIPITLAGIVKLLVPIPAVWRYISAFADFMMWCWCQGLALLLRINGNCVGILKGWKGWIAKTGIC